MCTNTQADKTATTLSLDSDSSHADLVKVVNDLAERVSDLEQENERLREQLSDEQETRARSDADIKSRVHDLEETTDTDTAMADSGCETDGQPSGPEPQTALEDLVTVPDRVIEQESANTQRAVFLARDLEAYTTSVPAGRAITSGELRRVLQAGTDASGHQQTVSRVMSLLDDLGGDETEVVERRGSKRLVFTDTIVARLTRLSASRCRDDTAPVGV
jgi:hypothetical protein